MLKQSVGAIVSYKNIFPITVTAEMKHWYKLVSQSYTHHRTQPFVLGVSHSLQSHTFATTFILRQRRKKQSHKIRLHTEFHGHTRSQASVWQIRSYLATRSQSFIRCSRGLREPPAPAKPCPASSPSHTGTESAGPYSTQHKELRTPS